jgi:DNA-binding NtrC family response regulator
VNLPPLRSRTNDIEVLAKHFVEKFNGHHGNKIKGLAPETMDVLKVHSWPGNIRELENVIEHAFVIETSDQLTPTSLPEALVAAASRGTTLRAGVRPGLATDIVDESDLAEGGDDGDLDIAQAAASMQVPMPGKGFTLDINRLDFQANKEEFERRFLVSALKAFKGRINQTALHANIPKKTLLRKLQKYGITAREFN